MYLYLDFYVIVLLVVHEALHVLLYMYFSTCTPHVNFVLGVLFFTREFSLLSPKSPTWKNTTNIHNTEENMYAFTFKPLG
jgi:hypothetical protein